MHGYAGWLLLTNLAKVAAFVAALLTGNAVECPAADVSIVRVRRRIREPACESAAAAGLPAGRPTARGPSPAVVLLHSCNGNWRRLDERWGKRIASWGYVTLTVDSFGPRGIENTCDSGAPVDLAFGRLPRAATFWCSSPSSIPRASRCLGFRKAAGWRSRRSNAAPSSEHRRTSSARPSRSIRPAVGFQGRHDRSHPDPGRRTRRLDAGGGVPQHGRWPRRLGDFPAEGRGRPDQARRLSRRLSRLRRARTSRRRSSCSGITSNSTRRRRIDRSTPFTNSSTRRSAGRSRPDDHQSRCVRRLWHALRHPVGGRRHRGGVSRLRRDHHPDLAHQAARIYLAALADAALPGFLRRHARLAGLHAAGARAGI